MLSWTLFYTTLFEMKKPHWCVIDPDGIIKSQVVHSPDNGVCLTLNGSDARHTRASDFITTSPGATVQHIAFATENIFKIAGHLSGLDGAVLPQTANYYEDIQARFGLASEVLEQLKAENILYDEDEEGQFYHFYCHLEQTKMFFEFVQRIEGYKGFGLQMPLQAGRPKTSGTAQEFVKSLLKKGGFLSLIQPQGDIKARWRQ